MQARDAAGLRREWGEKPCNHDHTEKEYHLGMHTGDYVCTMCGRDFTSMEEVERDRQAQAEQSPDMSEPDADDQGGTPAG
jgi:uncharacterized Zn finger protein (UPF0148 family)